MVPGSPPNAAFIRRTAGPETLTGTTPKHLGVLSQMLRLMSKPNKNSKRLKANIVEWSPSPNLSVPGLRLNQTEKDPESRQRCSTHGFWCGFGALASLSGDAPGMQRGRAGPELLRCSFVYADGFQMLASDRAATERWGAARRFGAGASEPRSRWLNPGDANVASLRNKLEKLFRSVIMWWS